jgi:hypothetical protein
MEGVMYEFYVFTQEPALSYPFPYTASEKLWEASNYVIALDDY